jgi:hypothetical protein
MSSGSSYINKLDKVNKIQENPTTCNKTVKAIQYIRRKKISHMIRITYLSPKNSKQLQFLFLKLEFAPF